MSEYVKSNQMKRFLDLQKEIVDCSINIRGIEEYKQKLTLEYKKLERDMN